ncbi:hypothetical protein AMATHDRAFT_634 [Amanita thiersii Skay4041]|uniref:Retinoic acid induced 16-like protein-domain-containing protein n=1 Tax=Amanita thiersii Skay4041 TaxID=703135 RepID=A0A2A9P092_9AGAR|nr:hypothetical protein AMATHDRAFT_634 [Amanita thiersii Skay4041]
MDYFSKFLRTTNQPQSPKASIDHAQEFHKSWTSVKNTLQHPDERQLNKGIKSTNVPMLLQSMVDALVWESTRTEAGGTGVCLEYLLKNDVLDTLVRLSESDRPSGIQAEVLRTVQNMVVLLDEQFLVHSAVHRAVLRLLRNCVGDDLQEQLDGRNRVMGAARNAVRGQPSEYEADLVNLLCILCSRIRTFRELLMIFFHDKHWYRSEPLFSVEEEDEDEDEETNEDPTLEVSAERSDSASVNSTSSQVTITRVPPTSVVKKPEYEFLLFNYLLRFVHREGQIGDFARAGLLFLMDVAMSPGEPIHRLAGDDTQGSVESTLGDPISNAASALAEYIIDGDFSDVLAAGLSAVYSMLPRKLEFLPPFTTGNENSGQMVLGKKSPVTEEDKDQWEAEREKALAMGIEDANSPDFKQRLDHFLKLFEFIQDIFKRNVVHDTTDSASNVGSAIVLSILDAIRRVFLENVLYPSILECSDTDGSAVAVMSYIDVMIRTLPNGQLTDLLVQFLVSEDNEEVSKRRNRTIRSSGNKATDKLRRRKSSAMVLLEMEAPESSKKSEYFTSMGRFTLKDLLLTNLKSQSQQAATCALQLLQSMLYRHPQMSVEKLLIVTPDPNATSFSHPIVYDMFFGHDSGDLTTAEDGPTTNEPPQVPDELDIIQPDITISTHEREMSLYMTLISRVDPAHSTEGLSTCYEHYLSDAIVGIEGHPAYQLTADDTADMEHKRKRKHRLNVNDPILTLLLESLRTFFSNTPEFNIALTGTLAIFAMDPDRSLAGWLIFGTPEVKKPETYRRGNSPRDDNDNRSIDFDLTERLCNDEVALPASRMDENSRPVIHTILHGLVTQLEKYRQMTDDFDKFLSERRQGLLFSENLTDALSLALDIGEEPSITVSPVEASVKPKNKPRISASSSLVSFLTPRKARSAKPANPPESVTPMKSNGKNLSTSPFGPHYQRTQAITVEPFTAPAVSSGPWTPRKAATWNVDEDVFGSSGWNERSDELPGSNDNETVTVTEQRPNTVTLSQLLDNMVILEESIKELVSIIHARRSLGIDSIRYL